MYSGIVLFEIYLNNGNIIKKRILYESRHQSIKQYIESYQKYMQNMLSCKMDFQITIGDAVIRGLDISAITIMEEE